MLAAIWLVALGAIVTINVCILISQKSEKVEFEASNGVRFEAYE